MKATKYVTPWFRVGSENPNPARPGIYEVQFSWPGRPIVAMYWTGAKWARIGKFKPNESWGDKWRGLCEPANV